MIDTVIILAADTGLPGQDDVPKCLLQLKGHSILENQIELLKTLGLKRVISVVGGQGKCWNKDNYEKIKSLSEVIINPENLKTENGFSLYMGLNSIQSNNVLIIEGDLVFSEELIRRLLNTKQENVIVIRPALSISDIGGIKVAVEGEKVIKTGISVTLEDFPWSIYSGIMKIGGEAIEEIKSYFKNNSSAGILDGVREICKKYPFYALQSQMEASNSKSIIGGSFATITIKKIVRKEVTGIGKQKLIDEINWLNSLPQDIRHHFPTIKEYKIDENMVYLEQPYYEMPSLRDLLFNNIINSKRALEIIDKILNFLFEKVYFKELKSTPKDYLKNYHFNRVWNRLNQTEQEASIFKKLINADKIELNGETLINVPLLLRYIESQKNIEEQLTPPVLSKFIHGDLHFENILINPENDDFILVDPRGYSECDFYYDLGKLNFSINGMYDFLHEYRFNLKWKEESNKIIASLEYPDSQVTKEYAKIREGIIDLFKKYSKNKDCIKYVLFNEAIHYLSNMPFQLKHDNKEDKAIAIYLTGVKLLNEFIKEFTKEFIYSDWININTPEEYERAKNWGKKKE